MSDRNVSISARLPIYESPDEAKLRTWVQLVRTFFRMQRGLVSVLAKHDVTLPQFDVLATLKFGEGVTQQELAERLLVTKGNVCGLLDRLERLEWVQRRPDPKDGRANRLFLTAAGRRKVDALLPEHDGRLLHAMRDLSHADVMALRRVVETLDRTDDETQ